MASLLFVRKCQELLPFSLGGILAQPGSAAAALAAITWSTITLIR
jgi:hypothetical protein